MIEVLEPPELINGLLEVASQLQDQYRTSPPDARESTTPTAG